MKVNFSGIHLDRDHVPHRFLAGAVLRVRIVRKTSGTGQERVESAVNCKL